MDDDLECDVCEKKCEQVTKKGPFLGNRDDRDMCDECFEEIFDEKP